jgi:penicillin-binding protein 1A
MAAAYATFANGGFRVRPWFVAKIVDNRGEPLYEAKPDAAGTEESERVLDPRNAFLMTSMMRDVVRMGTAARAASLGRGDLAGKTGTTNDHIDAWFAGYNPKVVAVAWIGFDTPAPLGANETGGLAALPIWMTYAGRVLKGVPEEAFEPPPGVVTADINPVTGFRETDGRSKTVEFFYQETLPGIGEAGAMGRDAAKPPEEVRNQIF